MPRVIIDRNKELMQKRCDNVASLIDGEMRRYHLDNKTLAGKSLINHRTLYDKRGQPEKFRLDELYRVMDTLGVKIVFQRKGGPDE